MMRKVKACWGKVVVPKILLDLALRLLIEGSRRVGVSEMTDIDNSKKRDVGKNGIGIKIIGGARFSSIAWKKVLNCQLLKIALSAMVIMGSIGQKGSFNLAIRVYLSMSRSEAEHQCMIG